MDDRPETKARRKATRDFHQNNAQRVLLARGARSEQIETVTETNGHDQRINIGIGHHVNAAKSFGAMPGDGGVEPRLLHVGV